ncbi:MAG: PIN domain-containing protein [Actinomycetota bacterium]
MIEQVVIDNSAWSNLRSQSLPQERAEEIADAVAQRQLIVCLPFLLEAGFAARSGADHVARLDELLGLTSIQVNGYVEDRAIEAQRALAFRGHHRMPPTDILIAALAERGGGLGVLHYDHHYDLLREHTDLRFESVWLAPRGSL